jgi:hypothetical protein
MNVNLHVDASRPQLILQSESDELLLPIAEHFGPANSAIRSDQPSALLDIADMSTGDTQELAYASLAPTFTFSNGAEQGTERQRFTPDTLEELASLTVSSTLSSHAASPPSPTPGRRRATRLHLIDGAPLAAQANGALTSPFTLERLIMKARNTSRLLEPIGFNQFDPSLELIDHVPRHPVQSATYHFLETYSAIHRDMYPF